MRNALMVLGVVAFLVVVGGAVNHSVAFDIDYVFGVWTAVSMFWIAVVVAAGMTIVGLLAAWLARSGAVAAQRKLEIELQSTYERLRAAEAQSPQPADDSLPPATEAGSASTAPRDQVHVDQAPGEVAAESCSDRSSGERPSPAS
jgi:hypothetical protein